MTNIPAAWYPDPSGSPQQRYWDGTQWTEHYAPGQPQRPVSTSTNTPYVFVVAGLPLLSLIGLLFWDVDRYIRLSMNPSSINPFGIFDAGYLALLGLGWLTWGLTVLFSWLDSRTLKARGVERPFHWAWSFLGGIVYIIGRTVILRRRGRPAFLPLWIFIAVYVLVFIVSMIKVTIAVVNAVSTLSTLY